MSEDDQTAPRTRRLIVRGQGEDESAGETGIPAENPVQDEPELVHPVDEEFEEEGFMVIDEDAVQAAAEAEAAAVAVANEAASTAGAEAISEGQAMTADPADPAGAATVEEQAQADAEDGVRATEEQVQAYVETAGEAPPQAYEEQAHYEQQAAPVAQVSYVDPSQGAAQMAPAPQYVEEQQPPAALASFPPTYLPKVQRGVPGWLLILIGILIGFISALLTFRYTDIGTYFQLIEEAVQEKVKEEKVKEEKVEEEEAETETGEMAPE